MYRYILLKEASSGEHFAPDCTALILHHDGAPMRLDTGESTIQKGEIIIRLLKGVRPEGVAMALALEALGMLLSLKLK